jgi:hypothetical protein
VGSAGLQRNKHGTECDGHEQGEQGRGVAPAVVASSGDAVGEHKHRPGSGDGVEGAQSPGASVSIHQCAGSGQDGEADGDVDEEHPPPVEQPGEDATEDDADRHAHR